MAPNQDRSMLAVFGSLTAVAAFLLAAVGIIVVVNDNGSSNLATASGPVTVTLTEFKIAPGTIQVPVGGSLDVVPNPIRIAELAVDKQAQTLLMPVTCRRQLVDLPDDMWTRINIEFYKDSGDAVFKALVD